MGCKRQWVSALGCTVDCKRIRSSCGSCISDGAAAAILCSEDYLDRLDEKGRQRAIRINACEIGTGITRSADEVEKHITHLTANRAYDANSGANGDVVHYYVSLASLVLSLLVGFAITFGVGYRRPHLPNMVQLFLIWQCSA